MKLDSLESLANALGVTPKSVSRWRNAAASTEDPTPADFDLEAWREWLKRHQKRHGDSYEQARTRKMIADAEAAEVACELAKINRAKIRGKLVETKVVIDSLDDVIARIKSKLLAFPTKLAPLALFARTQHEMQQLFEREIDEILKELAQPILIENEAAE